MKDKINIAELLKDCPQGMELDCAIFENVVLDEVNFDKDPNYPIRIVTKSGTMLSLSKYGTYIEDTDSKCVIFPKGETTWEGFVPPCKFKDGDILFVDCGEEEEDKSYQYIFILKDPKFYGKWHSYCHLDGVGNLHLQRTYLTDDEYHPRLATEEEKEKLFKAIKDNGYKWNVETKTYEKLVEPKFKVGDKVREKGDEVAAFTISDIDDSCYYYGKYVICNICDQDEYELAPNKFDINTLKPFDKVLVRDSDKQEWVISFFSHRNGLEYYKYSCINSDGYAQCIPYEANKDLIGTTNDCDDFYKTWKK